MKDLKIVEEKIELALCEVLESKTYVEISLITLFFMLMGFFTEKLFIEYLKIHQFLGIIIITIIILLFFSIVYLFIYILNSKHHWSKLIKQKKELNRDWTE
jgi:hypothetical protein